MNANHRVLQFYNDSSAGESRTSRRNYRQNSGARRPLRGKILDHDLGDLPVVSVGRSYLRNPEHEGGGSKGKGIEDGRGAEGIVKDESGKQIAEGQFLRFGILDFVLRTIVTKIAISSSTSFCNGKSRSFPQRRASSRSSSLDRFLRFLHRSCQLSDEIRPSISPAGLPGDRH
jgi:hypothetical protein